MYRYRKQKQKTQCKQNDNEDQTTQQAFFQQKAELDAESKQQYEMEANEIRFELSEGCRHELPTQGVKRQELKGEEHCSELRGDNDKLTNWVK